MKSNELCLCHISKKFTIDPIEKTRLYGYVYNFSTGYGNININDITSIHKYFRKKHKTA